MASWMLWIFIHSFIFSFIYSFFHSFIKSTLDVVKIVLTPKSPTHLRDRSCIAEPPPIRLNSGLRAGIERGLVRRRANDFSLLVSLRFEVSVHLQTPDRTGRPQMTSFLAWWSTKGKFSQFIQLQYGGRWQSNTSPPPPVHSAVLGLEPRQVKILTWLVRKPTFCPIRIHRMLVRVNLVFHHLGAGDPSFMFAHF